MHPKYEGELPEGWQGGEPITKWWRGGYIHLYRVTRPCGMCQAEISIDVTKQALEGSKKNAGLLLRNCPKCRAERKAGGPGSRGGTSRPTAGDPPAVHATAEVPEGKTPIDTTELEMLRTTNATMKEELDGLYMQIKELREQISRGGPAPKTPPKPVQTYALPPEPLTMAESTKRINEWIAKNNAKMPWEGS